MIELLELSQVLKAVERTGTEVRYYDEECAATKTTRLLSTQCHCGPCSLFVHTIHVNHSDLFDTVRHEAIHVVQACKGGPVLDRDYYAKNAPEDIKNHVQLTIHKIIIITN